LHQLIEVVLKLKGKCIRRAAGAVKNGCYLNCKLIMITIIEIKIIKQYNIHTKY